MAPITITKYDDTIGSSDVIARIAELRDDRLMLENAIANADTDDDRKEAYARLSDWDNGSDAAELSALLTLQADCIDYAADWQYGETLIRDSYFATYAQQLADDTGAIPSHDLPWPLTCIDWAQAARELQHDYTSVQFHGVTYWIR